MTTCAPVGRASSKDKEGDDVAAAGEPFFRGGEAAVPEVNDIEAGWEMPAPESNLFEWYWARGGKVSGNAETGMSLMEREQTHFSSTNRQIALGSNSTTQNETHKTAAKQASQFAPL